MFQVHGVKTMENEKFGYVINCLILALLLLLTGCEKVINSGEFEGFAIGMNHAEALKVLKGLENVSHTIAIVAEPIIIDRQNIGELDELFTTNVGIVLEKGEPFSQQKLTIKDEQISFVVRTATNNAVFSKLRVGMSSEEAKTEVRGLLLASHVDRVFNYMPSAEWKSPGSLSIEEFSKFDNWSYSYNDRYSNVKLKFVDSELVQITNRWSLVELP